MMEILLVYARLWVAHVILVLVVVLPVHFVLRKMRHIVWTRDDMLSFLFPYALWVVLMQMGIRSKSMANSAEALYLSILIIVAAGIRIAIGKRYHRQGRYHIVLKSLPWRSRDLLCHTLSSGMTAPTL
jgi:hypothetical protein